MTNAWSDLHKKYYKNADWIDKPSIFAETAIRYFPEKGHVLELGAGQGQDSRFFAEHGYDVLSTDMTEEALELSKAKIPANLKGSMEVRQLDMHSSSNWPFAPETFDVVYAHLSLHYFDEATTHKIFGEIWRVLKPGGVFAFFTNSTDDPEYGTGKEIEPNFFQIDNLTKRYFDTKAAQTFAQRFEMRLLDNQGETYKDAAKGIHNLIRYIGTKPAKQ